MSFVSTSSDPVTDPGNEKFENYRKVYPVTLNVKQKVRSKSENSPNLGYNFLLKYGSIKTL